MNVPDILGSVTPVVETLEQLKVVYYIGGSVASSVYGVGRTTIDVGIVADLRPKHIQPFVERLRATYYIDASMIADAIIHHSSFNIIHLPTMTKIDIFIPKRQPFDRAESGRTRQDRLVEAEDTRTFYLASPEDVVLRKLEWFKAGNAISERQWLDVLGVLKVQAGALDFSYLRQWAGELGLADLLEKAIKEAGL